MDAQQAADPVQPIGEPVTDADSEHEEGEN